MALDNVFVNYASGSDSNDGQIANPVKTLKNANSKVNPGGTVWLRGGTHVGGFPNVWSSQASDALDTSGSEGSPTIWQNYEDESVVITGDGNGIGFPVIIVQDGSSYITFRASALGKFTIDGLGTSGDGFRTGNASDHITLENMIIYRARANGLQLSAATNCQILNTTFEAIRQSDTPAGGHGIYCTQNLLVDGCRFLNCEGYAIQIHLPVGSAFTGAIFRNNFIDHCGKLNTYGGGGYTNTETVSNRAGAITLWNSGASAALIYNNLIKNCGAGIQLGGGTKDHKILFNTIYNSATFNFWAPSSSSGLEVRNNVVLVGGDSNYTNEATGSTASNNDISSNPDACWVDPTVGYGNGDFRLLADSPLRGAGVAHASVTVDWAGETRGDPPDIGYRQFVTVDPDPPEGLSIIDEETDPALAWTADETNVTHYRIYVHKEGGLDPLKNFFEVPLVGALINKDGSGTFNLLENIPLVLEAPVTDLYFRVQPMIGSVEGDLSNEVQYEVPA